MYCQTFACNSNFFVGYDYGGNIHWNLFCLPFEVFDSEKVQKLGDPYIAIDSHITQNIFEGFPY